MTETKAERDALETQKHEEDAKKRFAAAFSDEEVNSYRAVVKCARTLDEMVDSRIFTPEEATARLSRVIGTSGDRAKAIEKALKPVDRGGK